MNELKELLNELRKELKTFIKLSIECDGSTEFEVETLTISVLRPQPFTYEFDKYNYDTVELAIEGVKNLLEINKILKA